MKNFYFVFASHMALAGALPGLAVNVFFDQSMYWSPATGPYVENYLEIKGSSVKFVPVDDKFQAEVEVTYIFRKGGTITNFQKFLVRSPFISDTTKALIDFVDQKRFSLEEGDYVLEISIQDVNDTTNFAKTNHKFSISQPGFDARMSDLIFVAKTEKASKGSTTSKSGLDMVPNISGYMGQQDSILTLYTEIYNTQALEGEGNPVVLVTGIIDEDNNQVLSAFQMAQRLKASQVIPVHKAMDISLLPTGNYRLYAEVRNRDNKVIAEQNKLFQRYNPGLSPLAGVGSDAYQNSFVQEFTSKDSLKNMLFCVKAAGNQPEKNRIDDLMKSEDMDELKLFFHNFWAERNPYNPESDWLKYHEKIKEVDKQFTTPYQHGCQTDRGRVYLEYGKPSTVFNRPSDPSYYPYQIWHYYKTHKRANAKFVFYDRSLTARNYDLLHSNVYGELNDYQWENRLQQRVGFPGTLDETPAPDNYGSPARQFWDNPR